MNLDELIQKIEQWHCSVNATIEMLKTTDHRSIAALESSEIFVQHQNLLKEFIEEFEVVSEELQVTHTELLQQNQVLLQQNQDLLTTREALELERQRYQELFEFAPDGYLVTDIKGNIQKANHAAALLLNAQQRFLVGKPLSLFIVQQEQHSFYSLLTRLSQVEGVQEWEGCLQPRKRESLDAILTVTPVCDRSGKLIALRWLLHDITKRKQAELERLQRANEQLKQEISERQKAEATAVKALETEKELSELKSRFIAMISHEYRTPLTTILSSTELLERYSLKFTEEKKTQHLQRIHASANYLTQLVNDVLLINQIEAQGLEFKQILIDLPAFCQELVEDAKLMAQVEQTIKFEYEGECTQVYLDPKLLRQILSNLLSNAIKYSPQGDTVHFSCIGNQNQVIFRIQDGGMGIPSEDLPKLMQSFYRATNAGTIPGTGLGLAIVKKSVELHGGNITVESQIGVGTIFTIILPLQGTDKNIDLT